MPRSVRFRFGAFGCAVLMLATTLAITDSIRAGMPSVSAEVSVPAASPSDANSQPGPDEEVGATVEPSSATNPCGGAPVLPHGNVLEVLLGVQSPASSPMSADEVNAMRETIARRAACLDQNAVVQTRDDDQIYVRLHVGDVSPDDIVEILTMAGQLEIIDPQGQFLPKGTVVKTTRGGPADLLLGVTEPAGAPTYTTIISNEDLADAFPTTGNFGQAVVGLRLKGSAADKFFQFTSTHIGQPMSIVLDKVVISSPQISGAISDQGIIEGMPPADARRLARRLAIVLNSGPLPVGLILLRSGVISSSDGS